MEIQVTLDSTGFDGATVRSRLNAEVNFLTTEQVVLKVLTSWFYPLRQARRGGQFIYTVEIPVFAGEAVPENIHSFVVKVIRDKIRVLKSRGAQVGMSGFYPTQKSMWIDLFFI